MNLRKEIEKLILAIPIGFILTYLAKDQTAGFMVAYVIMPLTFIVEHLENFVIAIWIYQIAKKSHQRYFLWAGLGLATHIFAAVTFIVLNVLESKFNISTKEPKEELVETDL